MKIGVDIGGSHIAVGLIKEDKILNEKEFFIHSEEKKNIKRYIEDSVVSGINQIIREEKIYIGDIQKIGIAVPGTVVDKKIITNLVNLGIDELDLYSILKKYYKNTDIEIKNDAKCAAIAEKLYGNIKKYDDALFICCGTGVGGAVYVNGKMLEPKLYSGIEVGHTTLNKNGIKCKCGKRGCFDVYGSMKIFKNRLTNAMEISSRAMSKEILEELKEKNNEKTDKIIDEYAQNVSIGISNLINIFEPEIVVVGGSFAHYESILLEPVKEKIINNNLLLNKRKNINIKCAKLLNNAGMIGAGNL